MESKTESKLRLDFFLAQGLEPVDYDAINRIGGPHYSLSYKRFLHLFNRTECFTIKSLAPRENEGVQPVGDDVVVDAVYFDGDTCTKKAGKLAWALHGEGDEILNWKPNLDALIELQEKHKTTQVKPEVVGYVQAGYKGESFCGSYIHSKKSMASTAVGDFQGSDIKSKFRPVYKKRDTHHSK